MIIRALKNYSTGINKFYSTVVSKNTKKLVLTMSFFVCSVAVCSAQYRAITLSELMKLSETTDIVDLSNNLIAKDCELVKTSNDNEEIIMTWTRYNEFVQVLYSSKSKFPYIYYSFDAGELYLDLQRGLTENEFKKLSPKIEDGHISQGYSNERFYLSFSLNSNENSGRYSVCCLCLLSEEELLEKKEAAEMNRMFNSRFSAKELVDMVRTTDKNIIKKLLVEKQWEVDNELDEWFIYKDTAYNSYRIDDIDSSVFFFKPAVKIFAGFFSDLNDVNVYDEGITESVNFFIPNLSESSFNNIICLSLFRTSQDSLVKDMLNYGFKRINSDEKISPAENNDLGITYYKKTKDVYQYDDVNVVIITEENDSDNGLVAKKWYTIYAYNHVKHKEMIPR